MTVRKKMVLPMALATSAVVVLAVTSLASATHQRAKAASPISVSLIPSHDPCTGTTGLTHGIGLPSCPPSSSSLYLEVGEPSTGTGAANFTGVVKFKALVGVPGPPQESDVAITSSITDVRCKGTTTTCGPANSPGGPDYTGELRGNFPLRLTDHSNGNPGPGGNTPGTLIDIAVPIPFVVPCSSTASGAIGATCTANTSIRAILGNQVALDGRRSSFGIGQVTVNDGGPDGDSNTTSPASTRFAEQGVFVP